MSDITTFFNETLPTKLKENADELEDETISYVLKILGDDEGTWKVLIEDGVATVSEGEIEDPDCLIEIFGDDLLQIVSGELNAQMAYMAQKIHVDGDTKLALKLVNIITD